MARRRLEGLERVLGVNALFSTAYGNVGSSIYYALGLVASYALGLTPLVFIITGFFFFCTAASYAEATAMFPEAGGSSSFARRAFNEFWSFFAAWAGMLTYTVTIAISAFFVPHYIGGVFEFAEALRTSPGDIVAACVVIAVLAAVNVFGAKESTGINVTLAVIDFMTQLLLVLVGAILILSPSVLVDNVTLGVAPEWKDFVLAIPIGMLAYTGIETVSNMAEEAKDEIHTIPAAINRVRLAVFAIYFTLPAVALSALPVTKVDGEYQTKLGLTEEEGGFAGDPVLGVVKQLDLGIFQQPTEIYVGLLAATILFLATNAGIIGVSRLVYSMGIHRQMPDALRRLHPHYRTPWIGILVFSGAAIVLILPGQETLLGQRLQLRRPAQLHHGARGGGAPARDAAGPRAPLPRAGQRPDRELRRAAVRARRRGVHGDRLRGDRRPQPQGGGDRRGLAARRHPRLRRLPPPPGPRPDLDPQGRDRAAGRRPRGGVRLRARPRRGRRLRRADDGHRGQARGAPAPRHPRAGHDHRAEGAADRRAARATPSPPPTRSSSRPSSRVAGASPGTGRRCAPARPGRRIIEEAQDMRATAVVMALPERVAGTSVFGKTIETVLAERPCRVIIESRPPARRQAGRRGRRPRVTA